MLRFYLGRLKERAGLCSNATNEILQYHVQFASLMAQRIDDASESQYDLMDDDLETTRLAKDIRKASSSLSTNVERMTYELESFVSTLERVQVTMQKEQSLAKRIAATSFSFIYSTDRHHPDSGAFLEHIILSLQGLKCIDSLMQNPRREKSLRASTP